jgi:putative copper resistance protein D
MMLEAGLVGSRLVHFACAIILFGSALFGLYSPLSKIRSEFLSRRLPAVLLAAALCSLLSGAAWFIFTVGNMSGTLAGAFDGEASWSVLSDTSFGLLWIVRAAPLLMIIVTIWSSGVSILSHPPVTLLAVLATFLLASLAGVGHTQVHEGVPAIIHVAADAVHLLAAGAWLGGLLPLGMVVVAGRMKQLSNEEAIFVLSRFSGMACLAVGALVASGAVNGWFLTGSLSALAGMSYGKLPLLKLGLFGLMLCLAASNRFWLVPALARPTTASQSALVLARLRRNILAEQMLGLVVVGIVSLLGTLSPAIQGP